MCIRDSIWIIFGIAFLKIGEHLLVVGQFLAQILDLGINGGRFSLRLGRKVLRNGRRGGGLLVELGELLLETGQRSGILVDGSAQFSAFIDSRL